MRQLTQKQKKFLTQILESNQPNETQRLAGVMNPIDSVDDLSSEQWEALQEMNDTEILWQEVNRFINDWRWARI